MAEGNFNLPQLEINGTTVVTEVGGVELPQIEISGTMYCEFTYSGRVLNTRGYAVQAKVILFKLSDNSIADQTTTNSTGHYSFPTVYEPCYIVSLPESDNYNGVGVGV